MATTDLFTLEQAAAELQLDVLSVQRLIARERLPACTLGQRDPPVFRVAADALSAYVKGNCPDSTFPDVDSASGWFRLVHRVNGVGIERRLVEAALNADNQRLSVSEIGGLATMQPGSSMLSVPVAVSSGVLGLLGSASPSPLVRMFGADQDEQQSATLRDNLAAWRFLTTLERLVRLEPHVSTGGPFWRLARLYRSPADYRRLIVAAKAEILSSRTAAVTELKAFGTPPVQVSVQYSLALSDLLSGSDLDNMVEALL